MPSPKEVIRVGAIEIRYILEGSETAGALALFETTVPPNTRVPAPHRHVTYDETVYGLAGNCTFSVEGSESSLTPGLAVFIRYGSDTPKLASAWMDGMLRDGESVHPQEPQCVGVDVSLGLRCEVSAGGDGGACRRGVTAGVSGD